MSQSILLDFNKLIGVKLTPTPRLSAALSDIEGHLANSIVEREGMFEALNFVLRSKLNLTESAYKNLVDRFAHKGVTFNTHEKRGIKRLIQRGDFIGLKQFVNSKIDIDVEWLEKALADAKTETSEIDCIKALHGFLKTHDHKRQSILESIFAAFFNELFDDTKLLSAYNTHSMPELTYYEYLKKIHPNLFSREQAAFILKLDVDNQTSEDDYRDWALSQISAAYRRLNNHCYLFINIKGVNKGRLWSLYADLVLFAEKFNNVVLPGTFFKPEKIAADTISYIPGLQVMPEDFSTAQTGFSYEDCFILASASTNNYNRILITFTKNTSDETKIPCPACRSLIVRANSYPKLGVRSWECFNPLCPERSVFGRGKRYSIYSLIRQEAINNVNNLIADDHIKKWKFDIHYGDDDFATYQLIAEHYSFFGDKIVIIDREREEKDFQLHGRRFVTTIELSPVRESYTEFANSDYFRRYIVDRSPSNVPSLKNLSEDDSLTVYCGDAFNVLQQLADNSIDGAVTSPPYYNAREYSSWKNMYCYLYDMYNIYRQLFIKLKPGAIFLFNIFDYFDNEKTIVYSDMGKKRVTLGAYSIDIFKRIGFVLQGNIIWDKGEIEGKRFFNQGNDFPYYQKPYNSWEHIIVLQKPPVNPLHLPEIIKEKPVYKIFGGKNILGHTAPYPPAIPKILISHLKQGTVVDPFSGSMTTGRLAYNLGVKSINIELSREYCDLGIRLWEKERGDLKLF